MNIQIEIKDLYFSFASEIILDNINFTVNENDFIGIIGPNGGGKTTLLKIILGILKPQKGKITLLGIDSVKNRKEVAYVPQYNETDNQFPISVFDVVAMGLRENNKYFPWVNKKLLKNIKKAMDRTNISNLSTKKFGELSGGQKQRTLIARAIVSNPKILLLDEPTASVDMNVEMDIYELLKELNQQMTILLVSHDVGFISKYINKIACINKQLSCHDKNEISFDQINHEAYHGNFSMIQHKCNL